MYWAAGQNPRTDTIPVTAQCYATHHKTKQKQGRDQNQSRVASRVGSRNKENSLCRRVREGRPGLHYKWEHLVRTCAGYHCRVVIVGASTASGF